MVSAINVHLILDCLMRITGLQRIIDHHPLTDMNVDSESENCPVMEILRMVLDSPKGTLKEICLPDIGIMEKYIHIRPGSKFDDIELLYRMLIRFKNVSYLDIDCEWGESNGDQIRSVCNQVVLSNHRRTIQVEMKERTKTLF